MKLIRIGIVAIAGAFAISAASTADAGRIGRVKVKISPFGQKFVKKLASIGKKLAGPAAHALEAAGALIRHKVETLGQLIRASTGHTQQALRHFSSHFARQLNGVASGLARSKLRPGKGFLDKMRADLERALDRSRAELLKKGKLLVRGGLPDLAGFATQMRALLGQGLGIAKQIAQGSAQRVAGQMEQIFRKSRADIDAKVRALGELLKGRLPRPSM